MPFSFHRQPKLVHLVRLGFALMLLCMITIFSANLVANTQYEATTNRLIDHLYPARDQAHEIARLALAIDDTGAWYVLSRDPVQQAQLLQTYQQDAQALRVALSSATTMADTAEQRSALSDFTYYFFGNGGYYESQQAFAFAQKRAGQDLLASQNYVKNPFLSSFQDDIRVYTDVVNREIAREDARLNSVSTLVRFLNIGLGGSACFFGIGIAVFLTRAIGRLYRQIQEKNVRLAESNTLLQALSTTDPLTELPNHRALLSTLKQELERAQRYERPCSLLFLDLDHFKALNDGYGHAAGDTVLRAFAGILRSTIRNMDTAGRWGGEEFVVILPEANAEEALDIAERIRKAISLFTFEISGGLHLTCSVGVACYPEHGSGQDALLTAADQAMYGAKRLGRNQVRMISDPAITALLTTETVEGGREETALHGTVEALVTLVEKRDWSLGHHSQQVANLVRQLALAIGMSLEEAQIVALAGQLHDIGKVAIPDAILQKSGPLTEEEWEQMRSHSIVGAEVISCIPSLRPLAPVIRAHHERWDGQGYPDHLQREQIPLAARLIAVVDSYTVMITDRPYQPARPPAVVLEELQRCAGSQFDPQVVEAFMGLLQGAQDQSQREVASVA